MKRIIKAPRDNSATPLEEANKKVTLRAALEGIVLLKNEGALPIEKGNIALYGAGAAYTVKGGTGSGEVNERHAVSILEGLKDAGYSITTQKWIDDYEAEYNDEYYKWKHAGKSGLDIINHMANPFLPPCGRVITDDDIKASSCDTAIYVVARQAGEAADKKLEKGEFNLMPNEIESITKMAAAYKRSIMVINSGSYMDIGDLDEKVSAVIYFCQQGMQGGTALAALLCGDETPSGKLTDTWAKCYADVPCGDTYSYLNSDVCTQVYREGIYVGYRYYDTFKIAPRYPFGFGLSYTAFKITPQNIEANGDEITVTAKVQNTGKAAGKEVAQLYVSPPAGALKKEYQRLIAFAKTDKLNPGDTQNIALTFKAADMASYSEGRAAWLLEKGDYILRLGASSAETEAVAVLTLESEAVTAQLTNRCAPQAPIDELDAPTRENESDLSNAKHIKLDAQAIKTETPDYDKVTNAADNDAQAVSFVSTLTDADKADLCIGGGLLGMIATNGVYAPGAVGRTTDKFIKKGLINVNLADGPAGLRLLKESALSKGGHLRFVNGNYMLSALADMPAWLLNLVQAKEKHKDRFYQYTTSFPVETALAQTWNEPLCEEVGTAISREMQQYAVTFWLAPAMNIHRNPLCGRNFEYLSEDPLLSGKLAAAIVRGVQSIKGNYAVIKHFACNNCEDERNHSNSVLSERALREIYLPAFKACVQQAHAKSVMTSYNKVNGTYTPNSRDLCTSILRCEWGFDGVVMTDWFSTQKGLARADLAIAAGNDLIMPGQGSDKKAILNGLKEGTLSEKALSTAAQNIVSAILNSAVAKEVNPHDLQK